MPAWLEPILAGVVQALVAFLGPDGAKAKLDEAHAKELAMAEARNAADVAERIRFP
jgi:hypothetical protein